jgi:trk system potassium uptake protein TrkA
MQIVVLGAGRLGSRLVNTLVLKEHQMVVVDQDEAKFKSLNEHPGIRRVIGNIFDEETAEAAFSPLPDLFIVVTGRDNINLMVAQAVKQRYNIQRVLVRVFDPTLAEVYTGLGLETVCPTNYAVAEMCQMVQSLA